jgi:hypothetical protein
MQDELEEEPTFMRLSALDNREEITARTEATSQPHTLFIEQISTTTD